MALVDSPEQEELGATVRQLIASHASMLRVREVVVDGGQPFDPGVWRRLADLGLVGITIPEEYGGAGGSFADLAAALREIGRGLVPSPLLASLLAAHALLRMDDESAKKELLPQLAAGELVATLAVSETGSDGCIGPRPTTATAATAEAGLVVLEGTKRGVLNAAQADILLVNARDGGLFLVRNGAPGLTVRPGTNLDNTTAASEVIFAQTPAIGLRGDVDKALDRVVDVANLAIACLQSGGMKQALDVTAGYATTRHSFGQPIGSYQGVKHKLADTYVDWCLVDAVTRRAVEATDNGEPEAPACASAARLLASRAYVKAARHMMTLHGGIGFTWDHDAHLFYKNALGSSALLGGVSFQQARLARLLDV